MSDMNHFFIDELLSNPLQNQPGMSMFPIILSKNSWSIYNIFKTEIGYKT